MDSFMGNNGQEYQSMYFQHDSAPQYASTSQYSGVSAFSRKPAASLTLPGLPSNNDFDAYEYEGNTIQPSQLLVDNSFQAGGLAATYPEYPDLSVFGSGEDAIGTNPLPVDDSVPYAESPAPGQELSDSGQHAVQPQVNGGRQYGSVAPTHNLYPPSPPYESWENVGQPSFDGGFGFQPPIQAVDPKLTLRSTAGADNDDALFRQTLLQRNGEHRTPALHITTNAAPQQAVFPGVPSNAEYAPAARPTPPSSAPTPVRHRAARRATRVTKAPTVICEAGCGKRFVTKQVMETHVQEVHEQLRIPCDHPGCNRTCANKENLRRHKKSKHEKVTFECPYVGCNYTSTRRDNLKGRHMPVCPHGPQGDNNNE